MSETPVRFGTDGWRAIIADEFTFRNVRACAQGVALFHMEQGLVDRPLVVGYDTRFSSKEFAMATAEVLAGNYLSVILSSEPTPTPVVSYNIVAREASGGVVITASHNPPQWNGFKYRTAYGGSPDSDTLATIEKHIQNLKDIEQLPSMPIEEARERGLVEVVDFKDIYLQRVTQLLDLDAIRGAGLRIIVDAMHGTGAGYIAELLSGGKTTVTDIRTERNPAFPGMLNPEPVPQNLEPLAQALRGGKAQVGLALDGDADRLGVVDEHGRFVTSLQVLSLLALYFLETLQERGPIIRSLITSNMLVLLGERYGVAVHETGVGFKYIAPLMLEKRALLGGEESGGYAFRGHIPERDGILSGLFFLDLMTRTGKRPSDLIKHLYSIVGPHHYNRLDIAFPVGQRQEIQERVATSSPNSLAGFLVQDRDNLDGVRFRMSGGAWLVIRFSGTEPLLRIYAEAETPEHVQELLEAGRSLAGT